MANITVDLQKQIGPIKPMHGVGYPPFLGKDYSGFHYLSEANIPYSRLHDIGGSHGGDLYVDIPNLFRDFSANPYDPSSYDFAFTDRLLAALVESGVEPYFRLGVTIENQVKDVKAYRVFPPADFKKWAIICEHVIRHYTAGWADGFHYNIQHWEIWNEPDNKADYTHNQMWQGTKEEFYELYEIASKHLKSRFPHLKIGGYGLTNFSAVSGLIENNENLRTPNRLYYLEFFEGFLAHVKEHNCPLDFFSWHCYYGLKRIKTHAEYARKRLDEEGFTHTETSCNEWHCHPQDRGTMTHAALNTAFLIALQHSPTDNATFYDARLGPSKYGGLFNPLTHSPLALYYGFAAFGKLYALGNETAAQTDNENVYVLAAENGEEGGILVANTGEETPFDLTLLGGTVTECQKVITAPSLDGAVEACPLPTVLEKDSVYYIKTTR